MRKLSRVAPDRNSTVNHARSDGRREPVLGDLDALRVARPAHRVQRSGDGTRGWLLGAVGLGLLLAAAVLLRGPLGDRLWPQARVHALAGQAEAALARGHLSAADGSGARELFEAAQAIDPDQPGPREGLARVAEAALEQAAVALAADRFEEAHAMLQLARELSIPRARADALAERLREREAGRAGLEGLVARATRAHAAGRLHGDAEAALPLYARVLELAPDHVDALRGRDEALATLLGQAREDLRAGELQAAAAAIAAARGYDPGHVDLPEAEARLVEELDALRRRADAELAGGRVEAAAAIWQRLLRDDPEDASARAGLGRAAAALAARGQREAADFRFDQAAATLARARELAPDATVVAAAEAAVERSRRRHARLQAPGAGAGDPRQVPVLLRRAAEAEARGDLLTPPGDSAFDLLRAAQAIAPRDAQVRQAVARLLPSARACFDRHLSANDLARARRCLDAREALGEDGASLGAARRRLAQRWLAIGDERLQGGQVAAAAAALESARGLDRTAPGLDAFERRLRVAGGRVPD